MTMRTKHDRTEYVHIHNNNIIITRFSKMLHKFLKENAEIKRMKYKKKMLLFATHQTYHQFDTVYAFWLVVVLVDYEQWCLGAQIEDILMKLR